MPQGWVVCRLIDIGFITGGGTPKTQVASYWNGSIVWVTPADMSKKVKFISESKKTISQEGLANSSATLIQPYSIIMSSRAPIGYLLINTLPVCTSQGCKSFTRFSLSFVDIEYLYCYLLSQTDKIKERGSGTTFKEISGHEFGLTKVVIPPLKTQRKIVNKLHLLEEFF